MQYDVFISCKSEDYKYAEEIYEFLEANGIHTFLASKELRTLGESEYRRAISAAMKSTYHMIVFASNAEYVDSTWVYYEWDMFINAKLKGFKSGQIVTVLKDIDVNDVNLDLWKYESFTFENYKEKLLSYMETPASLERKEEVRKKNEELERAKRKQEELLMRQKKAKEELVALAEEYRKKVADLNSIEAKKLIVALRAVGVVSHVCPVCSTEVDVDKFYCPTCGWSISPVDYIDGAEYLSLVNERQLAVVRSMYHKCLDLEKHCGEIADSSTEKQVLHAMVEELTIQVKKMEENVSEVNARCGDAIHEKNELEGINRDLERKLEALEKENRSLQEKIEMQSLQTKELHEQLQNILSENTRENGNVVSLYKKEKDGNNTKRLLASVVSSLSTILKKCGNFWKCHRILCFFLLFLLLILCVWGILCHYSLIDDIYGFFRYLYLKVYFMF